MKDVLGILYETTAYFMLILCSYCFCALFVNITLEDIGLRDEKPHLYMINSTYLYMIAITDHRAYCVLYVYAIICRPPVTRSMLMANADVV